MSTHAGPTFSVLTAVCDPEPDHLRECLASVDAQLDGDWEHVLVDDASSSPEVVRLLDEAAAADPRRRVVRRPRNGGIVAASNDALGIARGSWIVLLDHDDVLEPNALSAVRAALDARSDADDVDVVHSDHDLLRPDGRCAEPFFKPAFSPERLRSHNYVTHLVVARRSAVVDVGGFRDGLDGAQDHDLLLRLVERRGPVVHVPEVLYHWRQSPRSVASDPTNKPDAYAAGVRAVQDHLDRVGIAATVAPGPFAGVYRIRRRIAGDPTVSVVIPTRGSRGAVWGRERIFVHDAVASMLRDATTTCRLEFVVVVDAGTPDVVERGLRRLAGDRLVVVPFDEPFNFSAKINAGAAAASGTYLLVLNDDTELAVAGSVDEMVGIAQQDDVGMVGAKLLFDDGTLQHGGHVYHGVISHALLGWPGDHPGPYRNLVVERECAGVTAAAALVPAAVYAEVGGMTTELPVNYNDVDFSLRVRAAGHRVVWTPHAVWYHFEQRSGSHPIEPFETEYVRSTWGDFLDVDPYYNPNLMPGRCDWLERPLMSGAPPYEVLPDGRVSWG
jgi:GT2 family glycosyltransferase